MSKKNLFGVTALTVFFLSASTLPAASGSLIAPFDLEVGRAKLAAGDYAGASEVLGALVKKEDENAAAWSALGEAYAGLRWFEEALSCYTKSDELAPDNGNTLLNIGYMSILTSVPFKDVGHYFDAAAKHEFKDQPYAHHWKYSFLKYTTIKDRSVTKEYEAWLKAADENAWTTQLGAFLRKPISHQKLIAAMEKERARRAEAGEPDERIDIEAYLYIGRKCEQSGLLGMGVDHYKLAMEQYAPGKIEWELARAFFKEMGKKYNWLPSMGFSYEPNAAGELEVNIKNADSFALKSGLKNGDVIASIAGLDADFEIIRAIVTEMSVGDVIDLKVRRDGEEKTLMIVMDADGYRPRQADKSRQPRRKKK